MTEKDVTDFESSRAIADRVEQMIATAVDGKLTQTNRDYIKKVVDFIERAALENKRVRATEYAGQRGYGSQDSQKIYDTLMVTDKWKPKQYKEAVTKEENPGQPVEVQPKVPNSDKDVESMTDEELEAYINSRG
jgi:DNA replication initiation complex subunit (GINS family)